MMALEEKFDLQMDEEGGCTALLEGSAPQTLVIFHLHLFSSGTPIPHTPLLHACPTEPPTLHAC
jgi:hypothetical protein